MKKHKFYLVFSLLALSLILFISWRKVEAPKAIPPLGSSLITLCSSFFLADTAYLPIQLHEGLGDLHFGISTNSPEAQKYFDQGLRLIYAFNHIEALRSFKEASRLDPGCPMAYWGQALALGPNLNDWNPKDREKMALDAISQEKKLKLYASPLELDFINAMAARFNGKAYDNRDSLNATYRIAMSALAKKYPAHPEALILYVDALMTSIAWDYWERNGSPKELTKDAVSILEKTLLKFPKHPGAHHLYIHLVEASPNPGAALASATFLENAMPKAGHIVHMPSHIYARVGNYSKSISSNVQAVKIDEEFLAASDDQGMYRLGYYPHNIDFIGFSAYMNGQSEKALQATAKLAYRIKGFESFAPMYYGYFLPEPLNAFVRFGKWNEILSLPLPEERYLQPLVMGRFARGLAFLRNGKLFEAKQELKKLDSLNHLDTLKTMYAFYNSLGQISNVATCLLRGEILLSEKKTSQGIDMLKLAVVAEDDFRYNEPPDWRLPIRHYLGAALLESGKYADAEKVFQDDLIKNPENGWALQGLLQSQMKQGKTKEVSATSQRFAKAWKDADITIISSRF